MGTPAVLIRKSTGEIIKHADYPRVDMQPIIGLDPDLEWLIVNTPYVEPDYDSRLFVLQRTEAITAIPHPQYPLLNQYQISFSTDKREKPEIIASIDNAETDALNSLTGNKVMKTVIQSISILFKKIDKLNLNASEQAVALDIQAIAVAVWKNNVEAKAKIAKVNAGIEPAIDELWQKTK